MWPCGTGVYKSTVNNWNLVKMHIWKERGISLICPPRQALNLAYRIGYLPVERKCLIQFNCVVHYSNLRVLIDMDNSGPQVEYREAHKSFAMVTVLQGAPNETCTMSSKLRDYLTIRQRGLLICLLKYRWFAGP